MIKAINIIGNDILVNDDVIENGKGMQLYFEERKIPQKSVICAFPCLQHNKDHSKSQVIEWIRRIFEIDQKTAVKRFNTARGRNCQWLIYDPIRSAWQGRNHVSNDVILAREFTGIKKRLANLEKAMRNVNNRLLFK